MSNDTRRALIASRAKSTKSDAPVTDAPAAEPTTETSPATISVADVAREMGINPKVARAKLRRNNIRAKDGRHTRVVRDSAEHLALVALLTAKKAPAPKA